MTDLDPTVHNRVVSAAEGNLEPLRWPAKDIDEILDYAIDWTNRLAGDVIVASTWKIMPYNQDVIREFNQTWDQTWSRIWFSGGQVGTTYYCTNHVTTLGERQMEQTVRLLIVAGK